MRESQLKQNRQLDAQLWTNETFADWLKLVNLQKYLPNLSQSGLHGALVVDNGFNVEFLFNILDIKTDLDVYSHENSIRKILEDEIKLLKKVKSNVKSETVFLRPLSSFRSEKKTFTLRVGVRNLSLNFV